MEDWKIRQEIYHRLNREFDDDLKTKDVQISDNIIDNAVRYFKETGVGWIYPAKSYMVGICYARWLSENFGGNPLDYLKHQDLLHGNDPYFKNYDLDKKNYDKILKKINGFNFEECVGMVPDVKSYFVKEFMIGEC